MRLVHPKTAGLAAAALLIAGCATVPAGPTLPALPGSRLTPAQFAADDAHCRSDAVARLGGLSPAAAANQSAAATTVAGTAMGAAAGAMIDGHSGAVAGAGIGLLYGALVGAGASHSAYAATQQQFDSLYFVCMYARGHKVPVPAHDLARQRALYDSAVSGAVRAAATSPADAPPPGYRPPSPTPPR